MITLKELAEELGTTIFIMMEFAPDIVPNTMTGDDQLSDQDAEAIRQAWSGTK